MFAIDKTLFVSPREVHDDPPFVLTSQEYCGVPPVHEVFKLIINNSPSVTTLLKLSAKYENFLITDTTHSLV